MSKKIKSTYDEIVESMASQEKKEFEKDYQDLLLSEMLLAAMEEDNVSVRELAKAAGVSAAERQRQVSSRYPVPDRRRAGPGR